jgi:TRAP-type C4-dicarboxylate transport system permease small subunit
MTRVFAGVRGISRLLHWIAGALAIGLAIPFTSWVRGHVFVDTFLGRLPKGGRAAFHIATRLLAAGLFILLGWNLVRFGMDLRASGEVSPTLELHFYPVAFGFAAASFLQVVVLLCDIAKILRGEYA